MKILIQLGVLAVALMFGQTAIAGDDSDTGDGMQPPPLPFPFPEMEPQEPPKRPNIIVIMADDYG
ncbi:MAG: hypothetical protein KJO56_12080, partial [Gammaproteobacteria bacterium]|nr:hypothetical protein [Gammaproteobacteria bacterium]